MKTDDIIRHFVFNAHEGQIFFICPAAESPVLPQKPLFLAIFRHSVLNALSAEPVIAFCPRAPIEWRTTDMLKVNTVIFATFKVTQIIPYDSNNLTYSFCK